MAYDVYQKVGDTLVPLKLTTDERLSNVEATCLDYQNHGVKHSVQGLTEGQKTQARANIGAMGVAELDVILEAFDTAIANCGGTPIQD